MYVPKAKREYGYYVLPILRGDRVVGRIEPLHDRKAGVLRVLGTWWEGKPVARRPPLKEPRALAGRRARLACAHGFRDARHPRRARSRIRRPARSSRRSTRPPRTCRRRSASTRATTTHASATRRAPRCRSRSRASRTREHGVAFSSGLGATTTLMHLVDPGERVVLIADVYGGVYRMTSQVYEPKGYRFTYVPASRVRRQPRGAPRRRREARLGRDAVEPAARTSSTSARPRPPRTRSARCSSSTTPSRRRTSSSRSTSAPTRSSTRRRSTSAATATSSAASSPRTTTRSPSGSTSCRSRSAPCPARSTRGSCCAGSRRSRCACAQHCENARRVAEFLEGHDAVERVL